jgi:hypothetical protein
MYLFNDAFNSGIFVIMGRGAVSFGERSSFAPKYARILCYTTVKIPRTVGRRVLPSATLSTTNPLCPGLGDFF